MESADDTILIKPSRWFGMPGLVGSLISVAGTLFLISVPRERLECSGPRV